MRKSDQGDVTMSTILKRTEDALTHEETAWKEIEDSLRPRHDQSPTCSGPSQCYWQQVENRTRAMALCIYKMHYGPYMAMMTKVARVLTEEPEGESDHLKEQVDMQARAWYAWAKSELK